MKPFPPTQCYLADPDNHTWTTLTSAAYRFRSLHAAEKAQKFYSTLGIKTKVMAIPLGWYLSTRQYLSAYKEVPTENESLDSDA